MKKYRGESTVSLQHSIKLVARKIFILTLNGEEALAGQARNYLSYLNDCLKFHEALTGDYREYHSCWNGTESYR